MNPFKERLKELEEPIVYKVNVEGLRGGPYVLSEQYHTLLHEKGVAHEHVTSRKLHGS